MQYKYLTAENPRKNIILVLKSLKKVLFYNYDVILQQLSKAIAIYTVQMLSQTFK